MDWKMRLAIVAIVVGVIAGVILCAQGNIVVSHR